MDYIEPKAKRFKTSWEVLPITRSLVKYYAEYTGYSEGEVLDKIVIQLKDDPEFQKWALEAKRSNKLLLRKIYPEIQIEDGMNEVG